MGGVPPSRRPETRLGLFAAEGESYTLAAKCVSVFIGTFYLVLTVGLYVLGMLEAASSCWMPQLKDRGFSA